MRAACCLLIVLPAFQVSSTYKSDYAPYLCTALSPNVGDGHPMHSELGLDVHAY